MNKFVILMLVLPGISFGATAKPKKMHKEARTWTTLDVQPFSEKVVNIKTGGRKVASYSEDPVSYNDLVKGFTSLKNSNEIESFINLNKGRISSFSNPSSVFFVAHLTAMQPLRGIVWRGRGLFEKHNGKNRISQSVIVSQLKNYAGFMSIVNPTENQAALFDYFVAPYSANGSLPAKIENEVQLQDWMESSLKPSIITLKNKLNSIPTDSEITWNQQIVYGSQSFTDGIGKDILFGGDEVQILIASYEINVAQIDMFCAYNQTGAMDLFQDVGKLYGFDGFLFDNVDGITGNEIASVLNQPKYSELWKFNEDIGGPAMKEAGTLITSAVNRSESAWNRFSKRDEDGEFALSSLIAKVAKDGAAATFLNTKRVLKGEKIRSLVTGEIVRFNAPKFFNEPPSDLKAFYPTKFSKNKNKEIVLTIDGKAKKYSYRDYSNGAAIGWNVAEYQKYFDVANDTDIKRSLRVMNHSVSGFIAK